MDFTVFDVETANSSRASICSIGIIRVENDVVVYENEILLNPETSFSDFNIRIHGIAPEMVKDKPTFAEVWPSIRSYFDKTILVAHNAKSMDLAALYQTIEKYDLEQVNNQYICTYELSRHILGDKVTCYRLPNVCEYLHVEQENHHNALDDTRACYRLLVRLMEISPLLVIPKEYHGSNVSDSSNYSNRRHRTRLSSETMALCELKKLAADIIEDNIITQAEAEQLQEWVESHMELRGFYPFEKILVAIENIMSDGIIDSEEEKQLFSILDAFVNAKTSKVSAVTLEGKTVCLSGQFNYGTKSEVEAYLLEKGATVVGNVTAKTDILIMGEQGNEAWKFGNYGTKYVHACKLKEKGKAIVILKESMIFMELNDIDADCDENVSIDDEVNTAEFDSAEECLVSWNDEINTLLGKIIDEYRLPEGSLYLAANKGKESVTSYSICIYEPEYPEVKKRSKDDPLRNSVVLNLKLTKGNILELMVNRDMFAAIEEPLSAVIKQPTASQTTARLKFVNKDDAIGYIGSCIMYKLKYYRSRASAFGCCSSFLECSDAKTCVHSNRLYSTACSYRHNLEAGRIFYGKNRNID